MRTWRKLRAADESIATTAHVERHAQQKREDEDDNEEEHTGRDGRVHGGCAQRNRMHYSSMSWIEFIPHQSPLPPQLKCHPIITHTLKCGRHQVSLISFTIIFYCLFFLCTPLQNFCGTYNKIAKGCMIFFFLWH